MADDRSAKAKDRAGRSNNRALPSVDCLQLRLNWRINPVRDTETHRRRSIAAVEWFLCCPQPMSSKILALALATCAALPALGQQCPQASAAGAPSEVRTLEGTLVFHDSIRKWFELKLDQPQCGQASIELVRGERKWTPLEVLRGCRIRSRGAIAFSPTGYYSLDMYQDVKEVESVGGCAQQLPFPDYSKAKPDKTIREYRVDMHVDYETGDHPILFSVSSAGKELRPWQAYADYSLTSR